MLIVSLFKGGISEYRFRKMYHAAAYALAVLRERADKGKGTDQEKRDMMFIAEFLKTNGQYI